MMEHVWPLWANGASTWLTRLKEAQAAEAHVRLRHDNEAAQGGAARAQHGEHERGLDIPGVMELDAHGKPAGPRQRPQMS